MGGLAGPDAAAQTKSLLKERTGGNPQPSIMMRLRGELSAQARARCLWRAQSRCQRNRQPWCRSGRFWQDDPCSQNEGCHERQELSRPSFPSLEGRNEKQGPKDEGELDELLNVPRAETESR
jgi:hypothetical protein